MLGNLKHVLVPTVTKAVWLKSIQQEQLSLCLLDDLSAIDKTAEITNNPTPEESYKAQIEFILYCSHWENLEQTQSK